jgi:hypothetical protein
MYVELILVNSLADFVLFRHAKKREATDLKQDALKPQIALLASTRINQTRRASFYGVIIEP